MVFARMCLLAVLLLVTAPLYSQEPRFQHDPIESYAARILTVVLVAGILLVLYSVLRYRGRTEGPSSWILLLVGVLVLPVFTGVVGTVLVFDRSERVGFCASCHMTMKPYVDDLTNPASTSLAALHYKNQYIYTDQCYQCHTSYGMHGTVEAKISGMVDTYKYYTGTYKLPIKMRTPYPNDDCLKCHAESAKWRSLHEDFRELLFRGEMKCMDCHGDQNPAHTLAQQRAKYETR